MSSAGATPVFEATVPLDRGPRDASLYDGFGCGSRQGGGSKAAAVLFLPFSFLLLGLRRRRWGRPLLLLPLVLTGRPALAGEETDARIRLAFLGVSTTEGIDESDVTALSDYVQMLIGESGGYDLIRLAEVKEILGYERQRQLLGCDEEECAPDFAGLLDAGRLLRVSLSRSGDSILLQMTLIDPEAYTQVGTTGMRFERIDDFGAVLDAVPSLLNDLFEDDPEYRGGRIRHRSRNVRRLTRERRWAFGGGLDIDVARARSMMGVHIAYRGSHFGFGISFLPRMARSPLGPGNPAPVGTRAVLRFRLFDAGIVHPQLSAGVTYFPQEILLARAGLYAEIDVLRLLRIFVGAAYEQLLDARSTPFADRYLVVTAGLAVTP